MKFKYLFGFTLICANLINCDDEMFNLDLNDILNEDLMPTRLLFLQGVRNNSIIGGATNQTVENNISIDDGTISNAMSTMRFHRKMMNEYMCTNFMAEQIVNEVSPMSPKIQKRMGNSAVAMNQLDLKENMLFDQGSSGYKNWLSKTTTLEDIYKHYAPQMTNVTHDAKLINKKSDIIGNDYKRQDYIDDDYEEGEVTGYAYHQPDQSPRFNMPIPATQPTPLHTLGLGGGQFESAPVDYNIGPLGAIGPTAVSKTGYFPTGHESYYPSSYGYPPNQYEPTKSMSKDIDLKDIFEIALTTLAFLSFGMFILHVLMCITMTKTDTNLMMMPMEEVPDIETVGEEVRKKRSAKPILSSNLRDINEITRKVLKSIEAVLVANEDNGHCLHRTLCEDNKQYRNRTDDQKIWFPIWGLGLSWLSSKMVNKQTKATSILESLKATALGIGGADCAKLYAHCDENIQINERKVRRRKREAELYELKLNYY